MRLVSFLCCASLVACGGDDGAEPPGGPPGADGRTCLALGVDYANGVGTAARLTLPAATIALDVVPGAISGDPIVRATAGGLAVVNRFGGDNVTWLDAGTLAVKAQISAGAGANPQDAAFDGDTLYAPLFGRPELAAWDVAAAPPAPLEAERLASYDDDGNPNAASVLVLGDAVAVTLGILDDADPYLPAKARGRVLVRPLSGGAWTSLELTYANPVGPLRALDATTAVVATAPSFGSADGCLEKVTLGDTPAAAGCLVENSALGGFATAIAPTGDGGAFVAVSDDLGAGKVVRVSADGTLSAPLTDAVVSPSDLAYAAATDQLVYNDAITGGLFVLDVGAGTVVNSEPLDVGLPSAFGSGLACW